MRPILERIDAALNPLMVKEVQQGMRNRSILVIGGLVLGLPLLYFANLLAQDPNAENEFAGKIFFGVLAFGAGVAAWVLVPVRAGMQFSTEVRTRTIDLTLLSGLSPFRLASGRWQSAALQTLLMIALLAPFAVAAVEFGGIEPTRVLCVLALLLGMGFLQCAACLLAISATMVSPRATPVLLLGAIGHLFAGTMLGMFCVAWVEEDRSSWLVLAWMLALVFVGTLFYVRLSAELLTPRGQRSFAGSKLILLAGMALFFAVPMWPDAVPLLVDTQNSKLALLTLGLGYFCAVCALYSAGERRRGSRGWLGYGLQDGCVPTVVYTAVGVLLVAAAAKLRDFEAWYAVAFGSYFVLFVGLAALARRLRTRVPGGFLLELFGLCVVNTIAEVLFVAYRLAHPDVSSHLVVLLPVAWAATAYERGYEFGAWDMAPLLIGVAALIAVRLLRPSAANEHG